MARISHHFSILHAKVGWPFCPDQDLTLSDLPPVTELSVRPDLIRKLVPVHCESELASRTIVLDTFVPIPLEQLKITLD